MCLFTTEKKPEEEKPKKMPETLEEPEKTTTTTLEKKEPERKPDELEEPDNMTTTTPLGGRNEVFGPDAETPSELMDHRVAEPMAYGPGAETHGGSSGAG